MHILKSVFINEDTLHIIKSVVINEDTFQTRVYNNCVCLIRHNTTLIAYMYYNYWVLQNLYMVMHILTLFDMGFS